MAIRKFRKGETTYTCTSCKKLTRNTGDEGGCKLCVECYTLSGIDNYLSDNGQKCFNAEYGVEVEEIFKNRPELKDAFPDLVRNLNSHEIVLHAPPKDQTLTQVMFRHITQDNWQTAYFANRSQAAFAVDTMRLVGLYAEVI